MNINPVSICYVPQPGVGHPLAYLTNIRRFKSKFPIIHYSDHADHYSATGLFPDMLKLSATPEIVKTVRFPTGQLNTWAINNLTFLTGVRIAQKQGYSHIIFLEPDCRVGRDYWDEEIANEYVSLSGGNLEESIGGSIVCFGPYNYSRLAALRWEALMARNTRRNFPIPTYGAGGSVQKTEPIVLVNGALGIYPIGLIAKLFNLENTVQEAGQSTAWDFEVGRRMWKIHGEHTFDRFHYLSCIFSSYGDLLTTEEERKTMLTEGLPMLDGKVVKVAAVHQIKSSWEGPKCTAPIANIPDVPTETPARGDIKTRFKRKTL